MPGFFLTFVLLALATGWGRFLADRSGKRWALWLPAGATVLWLLMFVVSVVISVRAMNTSDPNSMDLGWVLQIATVLRWLTLGTLVAMLPITALCWRSAAPPV